MQVGFLQIYKMKSSSYDSKFSFVEALYYQMEKLTENMIRFAESKLGSKEYAGWCLAFIEDALKSAIISKYSAEIPQRNPASCTRMRYGTECRNEARSYSMTACVQVKTVRSTGGIAA